MLRPGGVDKGDGGAPDDDAAIAQAIRRLLATRADAATLCPSEVARQLWPDPAAWRAAMPQVRDVATHLALQGVVEIRRGGVALDPLAPGAGPVRIGRGARFDA